MKFVFKDIFRSLIRNPAPSILLIICLSVGLTSFTLMDAYKSTVLNSVLSNSKNILGADLVLYGRRSLSKDERKSTQQVLKGHAMGYSEMYELYTMASFNNVSRLVGLRVFTGDYPFYGSIKIGNDNLSSKKLESGSYIYPELLTQLDLKVGDKIKIGEIEVPILGTINDDPTGPQGGISLAPKVYLSKSHLDKSGLISFGSTVWYSYLYSIREKAPIKNLIEKLNNQIQDPGIRVRSHEKVSQSASRVILYLTDFLNLFALVALLLSIVSMGYLIRSLISVRINDTAILRSLGSTTSRIDALLIGQVLVLGILSGLISITISYIGLPFIGKMISNLTNFQIDFQLPYSTLLKTVILALFIPPLIFFPFLKRIKKVKPRTLFDESQQTQFKFEWSDLLYMLPSVLLFGALSVIQSKSFLTGGLFIGAILISLIILVLISKAIFIVLNKIISRPLWLKRPLLFLFRNPYSSTTYVVSIALAILLFNLLSHLESGITQEMTEPDTKKQPRLFLFDIQDDQLDGIRSLAKENNLQIQHLSPLVRARIVEVNGSPFEKPNMERDTLTREQEREQRSRNRGYNLSYRLKLSSSETLVKGDFPSQKYNIENKKLPHVSVETKYADRLGWSMGDVLTFDVQGVQIKGQIGSFRRIKWATFQPNFFVLFQDGVLNEAPKSFLAGLYSKSESDISTFQKVSSKNFPNVSIVDVKKIVDKIMQLIEKVKVAVYSITLLVFLVGLILVSSISFYQASQRRREINLLKVIGSSFSSITIQFLIELLIMGLIAGGIGSLLGLGISLVFADVFFDSAWSPNWTALWISLFLAPFLIAVVSLLTSYRSLTLKPKLAI